MTAYGFKITSDGGTPAVQNLVFPTFVKLRETTVAAYFFVL